MERIELSSNREDYKSSLEEKADISEDIAHLKLDSDFSSKDRKEMIRRAKAGEKWAFFGLGTLSTGAISYALSNFPNLYKDVHGSIYDSQDAFNAVGITSLALGALVLGIGCKKIWPLYSAKKKGKDINNNLSEDKAKEIKYSLKRLYENN